MSLTPSGTLADPQQIIADLRRELTEARAERDEAQRKLNERTTERDEAMAEVLQVINSSPGDPAPVFDTMLEKATRLCAADFGIFWKYDGECFHAAGLRGVPRAFAEYARAPQRPHPENALGRLLRGERLVVSIDVAAEEVYRAGEPLRRALVDLGGARSAVRVPLLKDGILLGVFTIYRQEVRPFSESEVALLQNFAAQAVIAMENARLLGELRERTHQLEQSLEYQTATSDALQVISRSTFDLQAVLDTLVETAAHLCGAEDAGMSLREGEGFRYRASYEFESEFYAFLQQHTFVPGRDSMVGRVALEGKVVHIPDIAADPDYKLSESVTLGKIRTLLGVPLTRDGTVVGTFNLCRHRVEPFTERQIELVRTFADQAVIAMESARLVGETREALAQQTATAEVLQVINSSPGDLAPVFDAMLEKAVHLCDSAFGMMSTWDGERIHRVAWHGISAEHIEAMTQSFVPAPGTPGYRIARGENVVCIADLAEEAAAPPTLLQLRGRSYALVALRQDGRLLGAITIYRREVRPFTDKEIALLQNFAAQAVIAMENARLITETREALEQQTATAEVLQVINASPGDLAPVFDAILEKAHTLCGAATGALLVRNGEEFRLAAVHGELPFVEAQREQGRFRPLGGGWAAQLARGEVVHLADARSASVYRNDPQRRRMLELSGARTLLFVPLRREEEWVGTITAGRREVRPFSDQEISLLQNFAAQAVIAMENARLLTETREALEQQTATAEVLQVINSSPGNVTPVFEVMLDRAIRLCEAAYGVLWTYNGEGFRAATLHGVPQPYAASLSQEPTQFARGTNTALGKIVEGSDFAHFDDVATEEGYMISGARRLIELGGARTVMVVALRKDGKLLGAISAFRQEVRPFADQQIALLRNFAAQAVIAMENARLITETREALEQQTATAEVLGVINSSPGDLPPVFDAMVERAVRLCEADAATVRTFDGELLHLAAAHAEPRMMEELLQLGPSHLNWLYEPLSRGERVIHISDVRETAAYREIPGARERLDRRGIRSWLAVALCKDRALLGVLNVHRRYVRPFSDKQIALLENFAAQAVVAMENARLLGELRQRTEEVAELNRGLEARVAEQVEELGRVGRLKRFLAPQLAELIVSQGDEKILESHRREIVVVFCDLRGYTAFTETAEPEEVLDFLRVYHGALGPLVSQFEGTLDQFSGDGIMVFFNDPVPIPDPAERAVKMATAMREAAGTLIAHWRERGRDLGFGAGIAQGYATLGQIGFSERSGYTAIGTVCNVAARLCAEAKDGQILLSQLVNVALKGSVATEQLGPLALKGLTQPVVAYNVPLAAIQPALRVIEGGPQSV